MSHWNPEPFLQTLEAISGELHEAKAPNAEGFDAYRAVQERGIRYAQQLGLPADLGYEIGQSSRSVPEVESRLERIAREGRA